MESLLRIVCEESASACAEWSSSADDVEDFLKLYEVTGYAKRSCTEGVFKECNQIINKPFVIQWWGIVWNKL
jgi:hypothetical protein